MLFAYPAATALLLIAIGMLLVFTSAFSGVTPTRSNTRGFEGEVPTTIGNFEGLDQRNTGVE